MELFGLPSWIDWAIAFKNRLRGSGILHVVVLDWFSPLKRFLGGKCPQKSLFVSSQDYSDYPCRVASIKFYWAEIRCTLPRILIVLFKQEIPILSPDFCGAFGLVFRSLLSWDPLWNNFTITIFFWVLSWVERATTCWKRSIERKFQFWGILWAVFPCLLS